MSRAVTSVMKGIALGVLALGVTAAAATPSFADHGRAYYRGHWHRTKTGTVLWSPGRGGVHARRVYRPYRYRTYHWRGLSPNGDFDRDGVRNSRDRYPRQRRRH